MSKGKIVLAVFGGVVVGAGGGSLVTYILLKKKFDAKLDKELKEMEEYYGDRLGKMEQESERLSTAEAFEAQEKEEKTKPGDISNPDRLFVGIDPGEAIDYQAISEGYKRGAEEEKRESEAEHPEDDTEDA